jgi:hypothetical protein
VCRQIMSAKLPEDNKMLLNIQDPDRPNRPFTMIKIHDEWE